MIIPEEDAPRSPVLAVCPPATMEEQQYAHNQPQEEEDQIYENYEEATSPVEEQPSPEATGVSVRALYDYQAGKEISRGMFQCKDYLSRYARISFFLSLHNV